MKPGDEHELNIRDLINEKADQLFGPAKVEVQVERADDLFNQSIDYAHQAADQGNAAGYSAAMNHLRWAAAILNPAKYGTKVLSNNGDVAGYIIETGIRRESDPGFQASGPLPGESVPTDDQETPDI